MPDRSKPPPGYIVHDISTAPHCTHPWEFFAVDSKVGRVSEADAIEGAWEHYEATRAQAVAEFVKVFGKLSEIAAREVERHLVPSG